MVADMKAVILAGGLGTRLSEETHLRPKPMVEVGGKPILWHILKIYSHYGVNEFIICCGYKGYMIKEYFSNYFLHTSDVTFDLRDQITTIHKKETEPWKVTLVDTGQDTLTSGRLGRVKKYVEDETFLLTYGDGLSNVNILQLIESHNRSQKLVTVTAVQPPGRFGRLKINDFNLVSGFNEKPQGDGDWINGGFFIVNPQALRYAGGDDISWDMPWNTI